MLLHFTQPAALWLLLLAPLPLVLSRRWRPRRRLEVANAYLWTEARQHEREGPAIRNVRRRWSAVLQALALVALAAALARPTMMSDPLPLAVVVDVSASMGAGANGSTRLSLAQQAVRHELEALPSGTRVAIVEASDSPRTLGVFRAGEAGARAAVDRLEVTGGGADLSTALGLAAATGASHAVVVTDHAIPVAGVVRVVTVGQPLANVAVTSVVASVRELGRPGGDVVAHVRNFGTATREVTVEITSDGRPVHRGRLRLEPRGDQLTRVHVDALGSVATARVVDDDALVADNMRSAEVADGSRRIRVGYAGRPTGALHAALAALPSIELVPATRVVDAPSCVDEAHLTDVDVLVIDGCTPTSPSRPSFVVVQQGRAAVRGAATVADAVHPVTASLAFDEATTITGHALEPDFGEVTIIRGDDRPVALASERAGRRVVSVGIDLERSAVVLTPAFPVFVANAVEWLAGADTRTQAPTAPRARVDARESDLTAPPVDDTPLTLVAGASPDRDVTAWVLLIGVGVLAAEWHLRARGM